MKVDFDPESPPPIIGGAWKDRFPIFHWLYHTINHPAFTFQITTYKANALNNVCSHAWGYIDCDPGHETYFIMSLDRRGHTYENVHREGVFCINYETQPCPGLGETVHHNAYEDDEIAASGLTAAKCVRIEAPRIAECGLHLECRVIWEKEIPESTKVIIAGQIVYVTMEDALLDTDYRRKLSAFNTRMCYTQQIDPLNERASAAGGDGTLDPVRFTDWGG